MKEDEVKKSVIEAGHRLLKKGLTARTWGNISARIDEDTMIITPSGRDYQTMELDELVKVAISDLSYSGNVKPSVEKSFHAGIYRLHPEANFIIHTHQLYASAASIVGRDELPIDDKKYPLLGDRLICADYGIPGSKKLSGNVLKAVGNSTGKAVLMKSHGAVCFGADMDEAFEASVQLEDVCRQVIEDRYAKLSGRKTKDLYDMTSYSISKLYGIDEKTEGKASSYDYSSQRGKDGAVFLDMNLESLELEEAKLYKRIQCDIYNEFPQVNNIVFLDSPSVKAVSSYGLDLKPLLDDFAQMDGTIVRNVPLEREKILSALKNSSAVLIKDGGALCIGKTKSDAEAASIILDKACICLMAAALFNNVKYLNPIECFIMRKVYFNKYSKKKNKS